MTVRQLQKKLKAKAETQTAAEIAEEIVERRVGELMDGPNEFFDECDNVHTVEDAEERLVAAVKREGTTDDEQALWHAGYLLGVAVGRRIGGGR